MGNILMHKLQEVACSNYTNHALRSNHLFASSFPPFSPPKTLLVSSFSNSTSISFFFCGNSISTSQGRLEIHPPHAYGTLASLATTD